MADTEFNFVKLNGKNYAMWKFGVNIALGSADLAGYVDGEEAEPDKSTKPVDWKKWKTSSLKAMSILVGSVEMKLHPYLINCTTPKEVWNKLEQRFGTTSEDAKHNAWEQFYAFNINEGEDVAQRIENFECICKKLSDADDKPSDQAVMTKLLKSLPPRFSPFLMAWQSTPKAEKTKETMVSRILYENTRLGEVEDKLSSLALEVQALKAQTHTKTNAVQSGRARKPDNKRKIEELKKRTKCAICKEKGHWARECPNKSGRKNVSGAQPKALLVESGYISDVSAFYSKTTSNDEDIWLADSGASMHMTFRKDFFASVNLLNETRHVKIADDKILPVTGIGTVVISEQVNGKVIERELQTYLRDKNGKLTSYGVRHGGLFRMLFEVKVPAQCNVAEPKHSMLKLWHERMGHANIRAVLNTSKVFGDKDLVLEKVEDFQCEACIMGKQTRKPHKTVKHESNFKPGQKIHTDVCGPINIESPRGSKYFLLFKDECTSFRKVYFLRHKAEVFGKFLDFENFVHTQTGNNIKVLRSDNGREYTSEEFRKHMEKQGIIHEFSSPYIHEQNGKAEREMRTIVESARTMLIGSSVDLELWPEAINSACYVLNRIILKQGETMTPFEKWFSRKPEIKHLRVFGTDAYLNMPKEKRKKFDPKSKKMIIVGYNGESTNYRLWDKDSRKIYVSSDVDFNERNTNHSEQRGNRIYRYQIDFGLPEEHDIRTIDDADHQQTVDEVGEERFIGEQQQRQIDIPDEPQVRRLRDRSKMNIIDRYGVPVSHIADIVPMTYTEAMSSSDAAKWQDAVQEEFKEFDVKTAFLYGNLEEEIYLQLPEGYTNEDNSGLVLKNCQVYLALYVDDGLVISESQCAIDEVLRYLKSMFNITVDLANEFIGMEITRDRPNRVIKISQSNYIDKIISKFCMDEAYPVSVPAEPGLLLSKKMNACETDERIPYREAVGSLLFSARVCRPDIEYAVNYASQFLNSFSQEHWQAVKRIIRYLIGTRDLGIIFGNSGSTEICRFTDADYAGCLETRRSRSGFVFLLNGGPICWSSQRQPIVSLSTAEAEYIALTHGTKEAIWLRQMLKELGISCDSIPIFVDNQSAIKIANNSEYHKRSKHIDVRFHFIRDVLNRKEIEINYVQSKQQLADIFTKPLAKQKFCFLREKLNIVNVSK
ncbi:Retrovirus-related Pol polyprotein from transposon TNT 1-94 [Anthophora quadrimaculata]